MNQVAAVVAPTNITQATVVAERVTAVNSVAVAQTAKVDMGTASAPALRGPANAALPAGPSVGPRQIVENGNTVGTGTAVDMGSGSSVREGIASNRDVLGSPDGAPLANVATRVGDGFMRGDGGNGSGSGGGDISDCLSRPEVMQYQEQVRQRMYARWVRAGRRAREPEGSAALRARRQRFGDEDRARQRDRPGTRPDRGRRAALRGSVRVDARARALPRAPDADRHVQRARRKLTG